MEDKSKVRMNLAAIKKVDPYANEIVDSSSHVAFYTFNSNENEWEKTDVEGAFFIYSRNAQPFHSIFINNRLNTNSFVEPITNQLELQSQPPFLLYRNERSRIRGFWFYNSQECDRIGNLVGMLVQKTNDPTTATAPPPPPTPAAVTATSTSTIPTASTKITETVQPASAEKEENINIFKLLSKAQQDYNNSLSNMTTSNQNNQAPCNVMKFFAAAKPTTAEVPLFQRLLPNTLSVEQLEKQQRAATPDDCQVSSKHQPSTMPQQINCTSLESTVIGKLSNLLPLIKKEGASSQPIKMNDSTSNPSPSKPGILPTPVNMFDKENYLRQLTVSDPVFTQKDSTKPALMPPTMFDKSSDTLESNISTRQEPLNRSQLVQAFIYLMQNDEEFVHKLHEAYLKTLLSAYH